MRTFNRLLLLFGACVLSCAMMACSNGSMVGSAADTEEVSRTVSVSYFNKIVSNDVVDIEFTQGKLSTARIIGSKRLVDLVELKSEGDRLIVGLKPMKSLSFRSKDGESVKVVLSSPDLVGVSLRGSSDFEMKGNLDTDKLSVGVIGSGDVTFQDIVCDMFSCDIKGSGDMEARSIDTKSANVLLYGSGDAKFSIGNASNVALSLFGSGDIKTKMTKCASIKAETYGSGDVTAQFVDCGSVSTSTFGSGDINLTGDIRTFSSSSFGSGDINKDGLRIADKE